MTYGFHPDARVEYGEAAAFYEDRRPGLGAAFTLEIEATIETILQNPGKFRTLERDVRICRTHTYPYAVLYTIEDGFVLIIAVMHLRRRPGYWHNRLSDERR